MGYRQYTSCVEPIDFGPDLSFTVSGGSFKSYAAVAAYIAGIIASLAYMLADMGSPIIGYVLAVAIGLLVGLIIFLLYWLYGRLICLGDEQCAIGVNMGKPTVQPSHKAGDDDATINIVLAPGPTAIRADKVDEIPKEDYWNEIQGFLTREQQTVIDIGRGYVQDQEHVRNYLKRLHCEFEGSGIRNVLAWAGVVLALLIAALAVLLLVPIFGLLLMKILAILAAIISAFAGLSAFDVGPFHPFNPGDPGDVNPNLATLARGDIVFLKGDWIYDSLHTGWNEIHAVHAGSKIGHMDIIQDANGDDLEFAPWPSDLGGGLGLDTPEKVKETIAAWCDAQRGADEAEEDGSRDDPANNWVLHPLIDGCKPPIIIT